METTAHELATLSVYAVSAQHSARLLGSIGRRASDPRLRLEIARRANDALRHAGLWTDTIRALGGKPQTDATTLQAQYEAECGPVGSVLEVLVLTQVAERRLARQMLRHFHRADVHPIVRAMLRRMIEEELNPGWCTAWLEQAAGTEAELVRALGHRYAEADRAIADPFEERFSWKDAA